MAWIRTSFTFLGFGFTIYTILKALQDFGKTFPHENTPRNLGLFLSCDGNILDTVRHNRLLVDAP